MITSDFLAISGAKMTLRNPADTSEIDLFHNELFNLQEPVDQ